MRLYFFISCLCLCFSSIAQKPEYQSLLLDKSLTANANAVVRVDKKVVEISSIHEMIIKNTRVVTILNKKGNNHVGAEEWYDGNRKIKKISAIIYDSFGTEIEKIRGKDFIDVSAVDGGTLYSDSRMKYLSYTPSEYPYTVEFESEIVTSNTVHIPSWYFISDFNVSIEKSEISIIYDKSVGILTKEDNFNEKIKNYSKDGLIKYTAENLRAIKYESLTPDFISLVPVLKIAPKNFNYEGYTGSTGSWKEIGKWMYSNLLVDRTELSEITKNSVRRLINGIVDPIEKSKKIYQYVQDNTRYISVQEGVGGIQPISAAEVDRVKYGDCKGLTNYTKALLDVVGVKSNYTRVYASPRRQKGMDRDFPTFLGQSNHVILQIPLENDEPIWLECTSQVQPFGFLGDFTDNRDVFVVSPEGGEIVKTPAYKNEQNIQKISAICNLDMKAKGIQYDNRFHIENLSNDKIVNWYKSTWSNINNLKIISSNFENNRDDVVFNEKLVLKATNYASKSGNRILFAPNILNKNEYVPKRYRNRMFPFEITRGFLDEDDFKIKIPEEYEVESLPDDKNIETEFGRYQISIEKTDDNYLNYKRSLLIKKGIYPKEQYGSYRSFRKDVARNDAAQIVLLKK
jgi:transglutaminase-like putative cysteine protease